MLPKIRYRLVYNYANRLNQDGLGLVAVECRQGKKKIYMSTRVLIKPEQWCRCGGMVIDHPNADKLTAYLVKFRNSIEEIELNALIKGRHISLSQLKLSVKNYSTIAALSTGVGIDRKTTISVGEHLDVTGYCIMYIDYNGGEDSGLYFNCYSKIKAISAMSSGGLTIEHTTQSTCRITAIDRVVDVAIIKLKI